MKFLHISDLHVQANDNMNADLRRRLKTIEGDSRYAYHYLIITGDIIDNEGKVIPGTPLPAGLNGHTLIGALAVPPFAGTILPIPLPVTKADKVNPKHLAETRKAFANAHRLLKSFMGRIIFCPGNHDYRLLGNIRHPEFVKLFDKFQKPYLTALGTSQVRGLKKARAWIFPPPLSALIISLDSNGDRDVYPPPLTSADAVQQFAKGTICSDQLDDLDKLLATPGTPFGINIPDLVPLDSVAKIVILHHDPAWNDALHGLENRKELKKKLRGKVDMILFGHKHVAKWHPKAPGNPYGARHGALAAGFFGFPQHGQKAPAWDFEVKFSTTGPPTITTPRKRNFY